MGFDGIRIGCMCATNLNCIRRKVLYGYFYKIDNYLLYAPQLMIKHVPLDLQHCAGPMSHVWSDSEIINWIVVSRAPRSDSANVFVIGSPEFKIGHTVGFVSKN